MEPEAICDNIRTLYLNNYFMNACGIRIMKMQCGSATVALKLNMQQHGNLNGVAHGGLIAALADNSTGVTGATVGKKVVTSALHINFIKGAPIGVHLGATAVIMHRDERMIMMDIDVSDMDHGTLIAKATAAMIIIDKYPHIPENW